MCDMPKSRVLNVRIDEHQREAYERAAALTGTSVSALVTEAADQRAEEILGASSTLHLPSEIFDKLLRALEKPAPLSASLEKAFADRRFVNR